MTYHAMIRAANLWGSENDPNRRWFLAGWSDEEAGELHTNSPEGDYASNTEPWASYNSGVIASRDLSEVLRVISNS